MQPSPNVCDTKLFFFLINGSKLHSLVVPSLISTAKDLVSIIKVCCILLLNQIALKRCA